MPDLCRNCNAPIVWVPGYRWPVSPSKGYFLADPAGLDFGIVARTGQKLRGNWIDRGVQGAYVAHREHVCGEEKR